MAAPRPATKQGKRSRCSTSESSTTSAQGASFFFSSDAAVGGSGVSAVRTTAARAVPAAAAEPCVATAAEHTRASVNARSFHNTDTDATCGEHAKGVGVCAPRIRCSEHGSASCEALQAWRRKDVLPGFCEDMAEISPARVCDNPDGELDCGPTPASVDRPGLNRLGTGRPARFCPRRRSTCCVGAESPSSERWGDDGGNRTADRRAATVAAALRRSGSCNEHQLERGDRARLVRRRRLAMNAPRNYRRGEEALGSYERKGRRRVPRDEDHREGAPGESNLQSKNCSVSPPAVTGEPGSQRHLDHQAKQREHLTAVDEKSYLNLPDDVRASKMETKPRVTASSVCLSREMPLAQPPQLHTSGTGEVMPWSPPFYYASALPPPCSGKVNRLQLNGEDVKPCSATLCSASGLSGPDREWGLKSGGVPGEGGRVSAAAAAAAAAASFEKQTGMPSSRSSRLTRDFTDIVVVGKGGCGRVLKARHLLDGRVYAIKEIKFAASTRHIQSRMQLFLREVQCLRRLDSNENIVRYFSSWVEVNPLSKTSGPSHEEEASGAERSAVEANGVVSTHATEEAASRADGVTDNQEGVHKSKLEHSAPTSIPFHGKGKSDECLSFYSVSHSQTSTHSDPPDDCGTAHINAHPASVQPVSSTENGTLLKSADEEEVGSPSVTPVDRNNRGEAVRASVRTSCIDGSRHRRCEAATTFEGATPTGATAPGATAPRLVSNEDPRARCGSRVSESKWSSGRWETNRDAVRQKGEPLESGASPVALTSSGDYRVQAKGAPQETDVSARNLLHSKATRQSSCSATSREPRRSYPEKEVAFGGESAQQVDTSTTPVECRLPSGSDLDEDDASTLLLPVHVNELEDRDTDILKEGNATCRGQLEKRQNVTSLYPGQDIKSNSEARTRHEKHVETGGSEHAAGVVVSGAHVQPEITGTASSNEANLLAAFIQCKGDPGKRLHSTDSRNFSCILRRAFQKGRNTRSNSDQSSQGVTFDDVSRRRGGHENQRKKESHWFSSVSSPSSLRWSSCRCESRSEGDCAGALKSGSFMADDKHCCRSCGEKHCQKQNGTRKSFAAGTNCSNLESFRNSNCSSTEEGSTTNAFSTRCGLKSSESLSDASGAFAHLPNTSPSIASKPQVPDDTRTRLDASLDTTWKADDGSVHAEDKAAFQSAISVEDKKDCGTMKEGEKERTQDLFLPVPGTERETSNPVESAEGMTERNDLKVIIENQENGCCHAEAKASILPTKDTEEASGSDPPAFVALDDFWCCDDFGPQTQPDGLEIVFAEEASPSAQQEEVHRPGTAEEGHENHSDMLNEKHVTSSGADTSVFLSPLIPSPITGDDGNGDMCALTLTSAEQQASRQQLDITHSTGDTVVDSDAPAVSPAEAEEQRYVYAGLPVSDLPEANPFCRPDRTVCSTGNRANEGDAKACTADAPPCHGAAVPAWTSPVSAVTAAPASAERTAHELLISRKRGKVIPERNPGVERNAHTKHQAALSVGQQVGAQQPVSEEGQKEQTEQHRRNEQQQMEQQHTPQQTDQQQHPADASRTTGLFGTKPKHAGGTRVEVSLYIQMEYCPVSLDEYIARTPEIDPERNEEIMAMIVNGLYSCHSAGIMHRDLKPSNIFIKEGGAVKLGDFGLAFSEDMDDDLWNGSAIATAAGTRFPRDGLCSSRLRTASAFFKDSNRVSQVSPAPTPRTPNKMAAACNTSMLTREGRHEVQSPFVASLCSGTEQQELPSSLRGPQEPPHPLGQNTMKEPPSRKMDSFHYLHQAGDFGVAESGARCSGDRAPHGDESTAHITKSKSSTSCSDFRSTKWKMCDQYAAAGISSPRCQREYEDEAAAAHLASRGHSLPAVRCTAPAEKLVRVSSEGEVRQMACSPCSVCCRGLTAVVHPGANLGGDDSGQLGRQYRRCWHTGVQSCPASTRCLLQQGKVCTRRCSSGTRKHRPSFLNCVLALNSCGCPLDTPALLVGENKAAQTREDGQGGQHREREKRKQKGVEPLPEKATRCCTSNKDSMKQDRRSIQVQQRIGQPSEKDIHGNKHWLGRGACAASRGFRSNGCDTRNTAGARERQVSQDYPRNSPALAAPTSSVGAHPVVVVQPPPATYPTPEAATKQDACVPLSPHCLLPVRGTHAPALGTAQRAEGGERGSASCGNARSSEFNSGSARTLTSHPGSYLSPAVSVLASPVFSNRTTGVGTSAYAPPEQLKGGQYDYSVDIWSLGLIAIDLFTRCETAMERAMNFRNAREGKLPLSIRMHFPWVVPFCQWCLQKDPLQRPTIKELYTHQCLTGSVFAPRSPLISPLPVTHILAPAVSLSSSSVQATTPDVPVDGRDRETGATAEQAHVYPAVSRAEQLDGFPFLPHIPQRGGDTCAAAGSVQRQQWHICCRGGNGSHMNLPAEYKLYLRSMGDQHLGSNRARTEGLYLCVPNDTRGRIRQRKSEEASECRISSPKKGIRKGNTSPSLMTTPLQPSAEFRKSASAWLSGDEADSPFAGERRSLLHAPVPLSALTLPKGVVFRSSSPIRCSSPSDYPERRPFPAPTASCRQDTGCNEPPAAAVRVLTEAQGQLAASAPLDEARSYIRSSGDKQSGEVTHNEEGTKLCEKKQRDLPPIRSHAESEQSGSPDPDNDVLFMRSEPPVNGAQREQKEFSVERNISVTTISRNPLTRVVSGHGSTVSNDTVVRATTWSSTGNVTTDRTTLCTAAVSSGEKDKTEKVLCSSQMFGEDAGTGDKEAWNKLASQKRCTAENKDEVTERSAASGDAFGGTGSTVDEQYASICSAAELCERNFDSSRNGYSCTHGWPRQVADKAVLFTVSPLGYASPDTTRWEARLAGAVAQRVNRREHAGEPTTASDAETLTNALHPPDSPRELARRGDQANKDSVPFRENWKETCVTTLATKEHGRRAETGLRAQVENFNEAVHEPELAGKGASGENDIKSCCFTRKKSLEDSIHSAVKNYAQEVLDRCCEVSTANSWSQHARCGSAALKPVPGTEDHTSSSGVWRKSDLFELRMQCGAGETVRPRDLVNRVLGGDQRQLAQQQPNQRSGGQQEATRRHYCQTGWDACEENVVSLPTVGGSMHLRGFLSVSSRSIEPPRAKPSPLCRRAQIYMRSRRGEWKSRFAAIDKHKKVVYIFSDRNDATKAKRVIQIEGEDGYCGVLMWEENGSWTPNAEQSNAHVGATCKIHEGSGTVINATTTGERRLPETAVQMRRLPLPPPSTAEADSSAESCTSNIDPATRSELVTSLKHAVDDDATRVNTRVLKGNPARLTCGAAPAPASPGLPSSDCVSADDSLLSSSNETAAELQVRAGTSRHSAISEQGCSRGGVTGSCKPRSGSRAEQLADVNNFASADCIHNETDNASPQVSNLGDAVAKKLWEDESERTTTPMQQSLQSSTQRRRTVGGEGYSYRQATNAAGIGVQQRGRAEAEHVEEGLLGNRTRLKLGKDGRRLSQHHTREVTKDALCRGIMSTGDATEDRGIQAAGKHRTRLLDRVKVLCGSHSLKLHSGEGKADSAALTKKQPTTEERSEHSTDRKRGSTQQSSSQRTGRWNSWLAKNERAFGGWLVRGGPSVRKTEPEESSTSTAAFVQDLSPGAKGDARITARLPKTSQFLHRVSAIGVRSVCELNILLTHNSLLDDVWMRVIVGTSRSSCSAGHEEKSTVGTYAAAKRNTQRSADAGSPQGRGDEVGSEDSQDSAKDDDGDEAVNFVHSLMTCFEFTEVVGEGCNSEDTQQLNSLNTSMGGHETCAVTGSGRNR